MIARRAKQIALRTRLVTTMLVACWSTSVAVAQFDPNDPLVLPGRVVAAVYSESVVTAISRDIKAITGRSPSVGSKDYPYVTFKFDLPLDLDARESLREVFEDELSAGRLKWWDGVAIIDGTGGQTGSLWVSNDGIDRVTFVEQQAWESIGLDPGTSSIEWVDPRQASKGGDVLVAVLDTGVDGSHGIFGVSGWNRVAPFGSSMDPGDPTIDDAGNGLDDDGDGEIDEMAGHGTFLAGLVAHMAPQAGILPVRVLDSDGRGDTQQLGEGIMYAVDHGAHVLLIALGTYELVLGTPSPGALFVKEAIEHAIERGVTVVASVGNRYQLSGDRCLFPADLPEVIAVAGANMTGQMALVSNVTELTTVCAPAESVGTTVADQIIGPVPGDTYRAASGTSMSTAFVAGAATLVRAQHPTWPDAETTLEEISGEVRIRLESSSRDVPMVLQSGAIVLRPHLDLQSALDFSIGATTPDGDVDANGTVDGADIGSMLGWWGFLPNDGTLHRADQNRDFTIDGSDLGIVLGNW